MTRKGNNLHFLKTGKWLQNIGLKQSTNNRNQKRHQNEGVESKIPIMMTNASFGGTAFPIIRCN